MPNNKKKAAPQKTNHKDELCLSIADQDYIQRNGYMPVATLAEHLQKPAALVQEHVNFLVKHMPRDKPKANELMDRPKKGVVTMTAGASMAGDDKNRKTVTMEDINRAIDEGRADDVVRLKAIYNEQIRGTKALLKEKFANKIHYIISTDDDPDAEVY